MWSCFEHSISIIFLRLEDETQKNLNNSQINAFKKFFKSKVLDKIDCEDGIKNKIIQEIDINSDYFIKKFPKYISFTDKINYIFKELF